MRQFDTETLRIITAFENITNAEVRDCIITPERLYFLLSPGHMPKAIGKNGTIIKIAEKMLGKKIKVFEYSEAVEEFLKNLFPAAKKIEIKKNTVSVYVSPKDRGSIIGKNGSNIKAIREILKRNSGITDVRIV
ncbi:MAG: NusA-like transcription termination signal-binding factor [Candidatus Micrarchaeota archaeon]|nr:NusA-like transcription termination signal-binding factor [Candidatus Micrarchaeota archaeon]